MINKLEDLRKYGYDIDNLSYKNWHYISTHQILSESFIREYKDKVDWDYISADQNLSESFIRKFQDKVDWNIISRFQILSESFIREFRDKVNLRIVEKYIKLSSGFREEFHLRKEKDSLVYLSVEDKKQIVLDTEKYECHKEYFYAYMIVHINRYAEGNLHFKYDIGNVCKAYGNGHSYLSGFDILPPTIWSINHTGFRKVLIKVKVYLYERYICKRWIIAL